MDPELDSILKRYPTHQQDALISLLQEIQQHFGHLSEEAVERTSVHLGIPAAKIYGVCTFYDHFRFRDNEQIHIRICRGTSCHLERSGQLRDEIKSYLKNAGGLSGQDVAFSLEETPCLGGCGRGPVLTINNEYLSEASLERFIQLLDSIRSAEPSSPHHE